METKTKVAHVAPLLTLLTSDRDGSSVIFEKGIHRVSRSVQVKEYLPSSSVLTRTSWDMGPAPLLVNAWMVTLYDMDNLRLVR